MHVLDLSTTVSYPKWDEVGSIRPILGVLGDLAHFLQGSEPRVSLPPVLLIHRSAHSDHFSDSLDFDSSLLFDSATVFLHLDPTLRLLLHRH